MELSDNKFSVKCRKAVVSLIWPTISQQSSTMPAAKSFRLIHSSGELEMGPNRPPPPLTLPPLPPNAGRSSSLKPSSSSRSGSGSDSSSSEDELRPPIRTPRLNDPSAIRVKIERLRRPINRLDFSGNVHAAESSDELEPFVSLGPGRRGLTNFGATCYANSVLQVLANTAPLLNLFMLNASQGVFF